MNATASRSLVFKRRGSEHLADMAPHAGCPACPPSGVTGRGSFVLLLSVQAARSSGRQPLALPLILALEAGAPMVWSEMHNVHGVHPQAQDGERGGVR